MQRIDFGELGRVTELIDRPTMMVGRAASITGRSIYISRLKKTSGSKVPAVGVGRFSTKGNRR